MSEKPEINPDEWPMFCSFCGKEYREVHFLIAGPHANICAECVVVCVDVVAKRVVDAEKVS